MSSLATPTLYDLVGDLTEQQPYQVEQIARKVIEHAHDKLVAARQTLPDKIETYYKLLCERNAKDLEKGFSRTQRSGYAAALHRLTRDRLTRDLTLLQGAHGLRDFTQALIRGYEISDLDDPENTHGVLFDLVSHAAYAVGGALNQTSNAYIPMTDGWRDEREWQDALMCDLLDKARRSRGAIEKRTRNSLLAG